MMMNNDSSGAYWGNNLSNGALVAEYQAITNLVLLDRCPAASSTAGLFAMGEFLIPNYTGGQIKVLKGESTEITNLSTGNYRVGQAIAAWNNAAAVNQLTLLAGTSNLKAGCIAKLYGIR
jgi:hypothetical protein